MLALAITGPRAVVLADLPEPEPGPGQVKLRVRYVGICGSDLHELQSGRDRRASGMTAVMGHEFSATVVETGAGVEGLAPGDLVTVNPSQWCGRCDACHDGQTWRCVSPSGAIGYGSPGAYAEYVVANADTCVRAAAGARPDVLALTEPFAVALHTLRRGRLGAGEPVLITGCGPIGLLCIVAARHLGAGPVIASDPVPSRRDRAAGLGATRAVSPPELGTAVREVADGQVPLAVEASGAAAGLTGCLASLARGGRAVLAGVNEEPYPLSLFQTLVMEHEIIGSLGYTHQEFGEAAALIGNGEVDLAPVISHRLPLREGPRVLGELCGDRSAYHKVLLSPDEP
jgi:2-desacetyl-2-hydroxyethyl bacteriochlorophyllide A dehydrogenase